MSTKLPLNVKKAIRDFYDPTIPDLVDKIRNATLEEFEFGLNWEHVYAKVSGKYIGEDFVKKVLSYFFYTTASIQKKCNDDNLIGEALLEKCTSRRIIFEVVENSPGERDPTTVFEQGVMYVRTTVENFGDKVDQAAAYFEESFDGFGPVSDKLATKDLRTALPTLNQISSVLTNTPQYAIIRLKRGERMCEDSLTIDGPNELLHQLHDWIQKNIAPNSNFREPASIRFLQSLCQKELFIESNGSNVLYNFSVASILQAMEGVGYQLSQVQLQPKLELYVLRSKVVLMNNLSKSSSSK